MLRGGSDRDNSGRVYRDGGDVRERDWLDVRDLHRCEPLRGCLVEGRKVVKRFKDNPDRKPGIDVTEHYANRAALAAEYGFDATVVSVDGFDETGFFIAGTVDDPGIRFVDDKSVQTFVPWKNRDDAMRARTAIAADLAETLAPEGASEE